MKLINKSNLTNDKDKNNLLEQFLFCFTLTHINQNRKGGSENSPVDYFPDVAWQFLPSASIGIKFFYFCIKQLNYSLYLIIAIV